MDLSIECDLENFWNTCEEQLQMYTEQINNKMGVVGFQVEHKVLDKNLIGLIYGLTMTYKDLTLHYGDILLSSMHIPDEIIKNIKELLSEIQE